MEEEVDKAKINKEKVILMQGSQRSGNVWKNLFFEFVWKCLEMSGNVWKCLEIEMINFFCLEMSGNWIPASQKNIFSQSDAMIVKQL